MGNYTNEEMNDWISYFDYVKSELKNHNSSGTILVSDELRKINRDDIHLLDIREMCKLVEFLRISECIVIHLYHDWYRYIK